MFTFKMEHYISIYKGHGISVVICSRTVVVVCLDSRAAINCYCHCQIIKQFLYILLYFPIFCKMS